MTTDKNGKLKLTLTAEHYQVAKEIEDLYLEHEDEQTFASYCDDRIAELEKPVPKKYRCIKNSFPFSAWEVGDISHDSRGELKYSEHPFHFEEFIPEPVREPITMARIVGILELTIGSAFPLVHINRVIDQIKAEHSL